MSSLHSIIENNAHVARQCSSNRTDAIATSRGKTSSRRDNLSHILRRRTTGRHPASLSRTMAAHAQNVAQPLKSTHEMAPGPRFAIVQGGCRSLYPIDCSTKFRQPRIASCASDRRFLSFAVGAGQVHVNDVADRHLHALERAAPGAR